MAEDFKMKSEYGLTKGSTLEDWPRRERRGTGFKAWRVRR